MRSPIPIYEGCEATYQADSCGPLMRAAETGQIRFEALARGHYPGQRLPRGALSRIKSIGFWDAMHDQTWALGDHRNEGLELTFLEAGNLGFAVDGTDFQLGADDLTITRPWQLHRVGQPHVTAGRLHWVILDVGVRRPDQPWHWPSWLVLAKADIDELTRMLRHNEHPVWHATADVRHCFQRIARVLETRDSRAEISWLTVLLNELLLCVLDVLREHSICLDESLSETKRAVALFLDDLASSPPLLRREWTSREMAAACHLGVTQFIQYCRTITNLTPFKYLNQCRLDTAARILKQDGDRSITSVALECGFSSSQYFATVFHRQFGIAPSAYRESAVVESRADASISG